MKTALSIPILASAILLFPVSSRADLFKAWDASTNYTEYFNLGDNGGEGFDGWRQMGAAELPSRSINDQGFSIYAQSGEGVEAVGRSFSNNTALVSGSFSVTAIHDSASSFSGFALYTAGDSELLRWGVTTAENRETGEYATGFWYAPLAAGTPDYVLLSAASSDDILSSLISYSVTWRLVESSLSVELSMTSSPLTDTFHMTLDTSSAVTSIAALVAGTAQSESLHFDNLQVSGHAVPEPSTLALLLLGTLAFCPRNTLRQGGRKSAVAYRGVK